MTFIVKLAVEFVLPETASVCSASSIVHAAITSPALYADVPMFASAVIESPPRRYGKKIPCVSEAAKPLAVAPSFL
jgi:hypothetical protein